MISVSPLAEKDGVLFPTAGFGGDISGGTLAVLGSLKDGLGCFL